MRCLGCTSTYKMAAPCWPEASSLERHAWLVLTLFVGALMLDRSGLGLVWCMLP
jgi:hypothetical protein